MQLADRTFTFRVFALSLDEFTEEFAAGQGTIVFVMCILLSVAITLAIFACAGSWLHHTRQRDEQARKRFEIARTAHNAVVGYVCHELRNPLHVLETWLKTLTASPIQLEASESPCTTAADSEVLSGVPATGPQVAARGLTGLLERELIVADINAAMSQMRATVDDVLDFRRVLECASACQCWRSWCE